ncbi:MAG: G8 domain-containing protein, partial [Bacteroidia bacterium]|nr:G8 domain-containing protein [Bacteroidia bacterium]
MRTQLLFFYCFFITTSIFAQNTWVGSVDDKWSKEDNWSGEVPGPGDDVLIPSGFAVTLDTPANIVSITVEGNSVLNVTQSLIISAPSEFDDNVVVNWSGGDFSGTGTLTNKGTINMSFPSFDISAVLNNPGIINLVAGGVIWIGTDGVINNSGTGIIDFKADGVTITKSGSAPNVLNNYGTIKTSFTNPTDEGFIASQLINHDGIFQIESGTLSLNNTTVNLMGAQCNIFSGTTLNLNSPTTVSGTLRGNVFGDLNWNNDLIVTTTAVFDFDGNEIINWDGDLDGGGTLTNHTIINRNTAANVFIDGNTTLDNYGEINLTGAGDIFIRAGSAINNNAAGLIDFLVDGSGISFNPGGPLNNFGLLKGNVSSGSATINALVNNQGTIEIVENTLVFSGILNNQTTGIIKGVGTIDLPIPANFTNDGTIAPGASPGSLTIIGDYATSASSKLGIELDGLTQGAD